MGNRDCIEKYLADPDEMHLTDFCFHCRKRFSYVYNFFANWTNEIRIEAILAFDSNQIYPVCLKGNRASLSEDYQNVLAYMQLLDEHRYQQIDEMDVCGQAARDG